MPIRSYRHLETFKKNLKTCDKSILLPPVSEVLSQTAAPASICQPSQLEGKGKKKAKKPQHQVCNALIRLTWLNPGKLRKEINYKRAEIIQKHVLCLLWEWHLIRADVNYRNPPHSHVPTRVRGMANIKEVLLLTRTNHPRILALPLFCGSSITTYNPVLLHKGYFSADFRGAELKSALTAIPTTSGGFSCYLCSFSLPAQKIQLDYLTISPINAPSGEEGGNFCKSCCIT